MTKETKNTVAAETIVKNLKEFAVELHQQAKEGMIDSLIEHDEDAFVLANFGHDVAHSLIDVIKGKPVDEALDNLLKGDEGTDDEQASATVAGQIAVNLKTGDAHGIEDIKDPKLKKQLAEVIGKLAEKLGGK